MDLSTTWRYSTHWNNASVVRWCNITLGVSISNNPGYENLKLLKVCIFLVYFSAILVIFVIFSSLCRYFRVFCFIFNFVNWVFFVCGFLVNRSIGSVQVNSVLANYDIMVVLSVDFCTSSVPVKNQMLNIFLVMSASTSKNSPWWLFLCSRHNYYEFITEIFV